MPATGIYASREEAPDALRPMLEERDGKFILPLTGDVFGYVPKQEHEQFRLNNVNLLKERDDLLAEKQKYKGLDPEKAREALQKLQELEDHKLLKAGDVETLVAQRIQRREEEYTTQLGQLKDERDGAVTERDSLKKELEKVVLERTIEMLAFSKPFNVNPLKLHILKTLAEHGDETGVKWILKDNRAVAVRADGLPVLSSKDATKPLEMEEWLASIVQKHPDFKIASSGGGATGTPAGGGPTAASLAGLSTPEERLKAFRRGQAAA